MKIKIFLLTFFSVLFIGSISKAQTPTREDSLEGFSMEEMNHHLEHFKGTHEERNALIKRSQRAFISRKYKLGVYAPPPKIDNSRNSNSSSLDAINCTNIGFDNGTTAGWTIAGQSNVTSGAGTDPFGSFPVVFSGTNSLQLNNNTTQGSSYTANSSATRTLSIPATGTNFFKLHFAMDLLDFGHTASAAAKFIVNMYDAAGTLLPCPQYECYHTTSGDIGGVSFYNTSCPGNCGLQYGSNDPYAVTYSPWNTVTMDLSAYNGTNVTCKIICNWCIYNVDWAYCYIDAECPTTSTTNVPTCGTLPFELDGPTGFDTYSWVPPSGNSPPTANTYSINASVAGIYTLNVTLNTCATSSAYTFTYNVLPGPTPNFTDVTTPCSGNVSFTSTSSANGGPAITGYTWEWGDGTANGTGVNATHTYTSTGTNTITLVVTNGTCTDSISQTVVTPTHPVASFSLANNCLNTVTNYTSTSTAAAGIASQNWDFGDETTGTGSNPSHTYMSAGTYTVNLVVKDNNSCKDSASELIIIYPLPSVAVNSSTICVGQETATLTATGAVSYIWNPTTGLTPTGGSPVTGTPTTTTNYTVTGIDANGCTNTATSTITVNPLPPVAVNSSTICVGQETATLTATGAVSYIWNPTTGLTPTGGSPVTGTPTTTTNYTVTGTDANGCTNTATSTITVNPLPPVAVNSSTICVGQETATLTATGAVSYIWNPTTGLTPTGGSPVTGTPTTTTNYTVTGTDANGCTNTATSTITVNPLPPVAVNSSTICVGQETATLTATGAVSYIWNPTTGLTPTGGSPVTGTPTTTTNYTVTGTDANGCTNTATSTITVNPLPPVAVNSSTICVGQETATLTATGAVSYIWNPTTGLTPIGGSPVTGTPTTTTNYTVTGTDANGCTNTATSTITVNPLPPVAVNSSTICVGQETATLTATGAVSYIWNPTTGLTPTGGSPVTGTPTTTTNYTVTGTDANGCTNTATSTVTVNPLPPVAVNSSTICVGQETATLTATGAVSYIWNPTTGLTPTGGSPVTGTPAITTNYTVTGTDANGCVNTATSTIIVNPLPNITVNTATICVGQQIALLTASGASTYTWNPVNTLSGSFGPTVNGTPAIITNYTITGTDNNGCQSNATTTIVVNQLPIVTTGSVTPGCVPLCTNLSVSSNSPLSNYIWDFGNGQSQVQQTLAPPSKSFITATCFSVAGTYVINLSVTDTNHCINTATTIAVAYPLPTADFDFQPQPITILAPQVQFINQSSGIITNYTWNLGDIYSTNDTSSLINPSHLYSDTGTYMVSLLVTTQKGCSATVTKPLIIKEAYVIYVPNAFTPNGDGENEMFKAVGEGINSFKLYIFDRWGNNLFYSEDINKGWEGNYLGKGNQIMQEDVYVWKIDLVDFSNKGHSLHGTVTLLK